MSIENSSVLVDGTIAASAGTATPLLVLGNSLDTVKAQLDQDLDFLNSIAIEFSTKVPKVSNGAPNGYTKRRKRVKVVIPITLANGNVSSRTIILEHASDVESTPADIQSDLVLGAQLLSDSDFSDFWKQQSLA
jgi:hypothetical protein